MCKRNWGTEDDDDLEETQTSCCDQNRFHVNEGMEMRLEKQEEAGSKGNSYNMPKLSSVLKSVTGSFVQELMKDHWLY